jgi:hypothetical protein
MLNLIYLSEAWRIFKRSRNVKKEGVKRYKGNARSICKQIVKDCWNGRYFQVSTGHFCEFYVRDFGWCVDSLIKLGYQEEVKKTLEYALKIYSEQGLKTTITPKGEAVDIFTYAPDSLAFLIRSLRVLGDKELIERYKDFLVEEINKFYEFVIEKETGLIRSDKYFSSIKDEAKRRSSCYDNIMAAVLSNELNKLKLHNPLKKYDYKKIIRHMFWNGEYFVDDLKGNKEIIAGDANVFPFWTEVFDDKEMLKLCIEKIQSSGLDKPFPLKYTKDIPKNFNFISWFVPNYEGNCIWMHIGLMYIKIVREIDSEKAKEYINEYTKLIEKYGNFLEVFNSDGTPFRSRFYYADEGMLWCSNYLTLL